MGWIHHDHMADVHVIRQDVARARAAYEADPTEEAKAVWDEECGRRDRAVRALHREDGTSVKHLAGMFRVNKNVIRAALDHEE